MPKSIIQHEFSKINSYPLYTAEEAHKFHAVPH